MSRSYLVRHTTRYTYDEDVTESYGRAYLTPADGAGLHGAGLHGSGQRCLEHSIEVSPAPCLVHSELDYFGNVTTYLEVLEPHVELRVSAISRVSVDRRPPDLDALTMTCADAGPAAVALMQGQEALWANDFLLASPHVPMDEATAAYGALVLSPHAPVGPAVRELIRRIYQELAYRPGATTVATTPQEVLAQGAGVCQDFAHLATACLRQVGLPTRYVSGYLETLPPPGQPKRLGSDASHAWISVLLPEVGWVDLDPTNDQVVDNGYVVVATGRDYGDVPPLRGVVYSDGTTSSLDVAVDVLRESEDA